MICHNLLRNISYAFLFVLSLTIAQAQSVFEKGYFIDKSGTKTEGYIKFEDWNAHRFITYMMGVKDTPRVRPVSEIKEIVIGESYKLIHRPVNIDISGDNDSLLSFEEKPEWINQELFLRVLLEGKISLYAFEGDGIKRFFYKKPDSAITQLIYKRYKSAAGIKINDEFKETVRTNFNCADSTKKYFNQLKYNEINLIEHFINENQCLGATFKLYQTSINLEVVDSDPAQKNQAPSEVISKSSIETKQETHQESNPRNNKYLAIEINPLLHQLIDLNPNNNINNNLFTLQYSSNKKSTGRGINLGLSYGRSTFEDDANGIDRKTINRDLFLRFGYERKTNWGKRWIAIHGYDLIISGSKDKTETTNNFNIETTSSGWGIGPRIGLMYNLGGKIYLGTEATYYLQYFTSKQKFIGSPDSTQKTSSFHLSVPSTIFLIVKLN